MLSPKLSKPAIPANALQRCPDLLPVEEEGADMWILTLWAEDTAIKYGECAVRHDALAKIVKIERGIDDE